MPRANRHFLPGHVCHSSMQQPVPIVPIACPESYRRVQSLRYVQNVQRRNPFKRLKVQKLLDVCARQAPLPALGFRGQETLWSISAQLYGDIQPHPSLGQRHGAECYCSEHAVNCRTHRIGIQPVQSFPTFGRRESLDKFFRLDGVQSGVISGLDMTAREESEVSFYLMNQTSSSRRRPAIRNARPSTETLPRTRLQIKNSTPAARAPYATKSVHSNHVMVGQFIAGRFPRATKNFRGKVR